MKGKLQILHSSVIEVLERVKREFYSLYLTVTGYIQELILKGYVKNVSKKMQGNLYELRQNHLRILYCVDKGVIKLLFAYWKSKPKCPKRVINTAKDVCKKNSELEFTLTADFDFKSVKEFEVA